MSYRRQILPGLMMLCAASAWLVSLAPDGYAQTPVWKQLVEQQLLEQQFCKVEYYVAEEVRGEGEDLFVKARVHCTDGRNFDIERTGETMKFRIEECPKVYC
jgi:hypothetical protein